MVDDNEDTLASKQTYKEKYEFLANKGYSREEILKILSPHPEHVISHQEPTKMVPISPSPDTYKTAAAPSPSDGEAKWWKVTATGEQIPIDDQPVIDVEAKPPKKSIRERLSDAFGRKKSAEPTQADIEEAEDIADVPSYDDIKKEMGARPSRSPQKYDEPEPPVDDLEPEDAEAPSFFKKAFGKSKPRDTLAEDEDLDDDFDESPPSRRFPGRAVRRPMSSPGDSMFAGLAQDDDDEDAFGVFGGGGRPKLGASSFAADKPRPHRNSSPFGDLIGTGGPGKLDVNMGGFGAGQMPVTYIAGGQFRAPAGSRIGAPAPISFEDRMFGRPARINVKIGRPAPIRDARLKSPKAPITSRYARPGKVNLKTARPRRPHETHVPTSTRAFTSLENFEAALPGLSINPARAPAKPSRPRKIALKTSKQKPKNFLELLRT